MNTPNEGSNPIYSLIGLLWLGDSQMDAESFCFNFLHILPENVIEEMKLWYETTISIVGSRKIRQNILDRLKEGINLLSWITTSSRNREQCQKGKGSENPPIVLNEQQLVKFYDELVKKFPKRPKKTVLPLEPGGRYFILLSRLEGHSKIQFAKYIFTRTCLYIMFFENLNFIRRTLPNDIVLDKMSVESEEFIKECLETEGKDVNAYYSIISKCFLSVNLNNVELKKDSSFSEFKRIHKKRMYELFLHKAEVIVKTNSGIFPSKDWTIGNWGKELFSLSYIDFDDYLRFKMSNTSKALFTNLDSRVVADFTRVIDSTRFGKLKKRLRKLAKCYDENQSVDCFIKHGDTKYKRIVHAKDFEDLILTRYGDIKESFIVKRLLTNRLKSIMVTDDKVNASFIRFFIKISNLRRDNEQFFVNVNRATKDIPSWPAEYGNKKCILVPMFPFEKVVYTERLSVMNGNIIPKTVNNLEDIFDEKRFFNRFTIGGHRHSFFKTFRDSWVDDSFYLDKGYRNITSLVKFKTSDLAGIDIAGVNYKVTIGFHTQRTSKNDFRVAKDSLVVVYRNSSWDIIAIHPYESKEITDAFFLPQKSRSLLPILPMMCRQPPNNADKKLYVLKRMFSEDVTIHIKTDKDRGLVTQNAPDLYKFLSELQRHEQFRHTEKILKDFETIITVIRYNSKKIAITYPEYIPNNTDSYFNNLLKILVGGSAVAGALSFFGKEAKPKKGLKITSTTRCSIGSLDGKYFEIKITSQNNILPEDIYEKLVTQINKYCRDRKCEVKYNNLRGNLGLKHVVAESSAGSPVGERSNFEEHSQLANTTTNTSESEETENSDDESTDKESCEDYKSSDEENFEEEEPQPENEENFEEEPQPENEENFEEEPQPENEENFDEEPQPDNEENLEDDKPINKEILDDELESKESSEEEPRLPQVLEEQDDDWEKVSDTDVLRESKGKGRKSLSVSKTTYEDDKEDENKANNLFMGFFK